MLRSLTFTIVLAALASACFAAKGPEVIDPEVAIKEPDFLNQGEYLGEAQWPGKDQTKAGAQVVALGDGKFRAVLYRGGLPGDGWTRGDDRLFMDGDAADGAVQFSGTEFPSGTIQDKQLVIQDTEGAELGTLVRIERKSPTLEAKPPKGALVLFDGTHSDHFPDGTLTEMKTLQAGCTLQGEYKISKLHIEFRLSWKPQARGQARSNSGVYIGGIPEVQVLDSFGLEGDNRECGAFYGRSDPDVNMCFPPLVWQTYDVQFSQPKTDADGKSTENVLVTIRHNGVVIHQDYDTRKKESPPRRLHLQSHGNHVQYRNIWLLESESE